MNIALMRVHQGLEYQLHVFRKGGRGYPIISFMYVPFVASPGGLVEEMSEEEDRVRISTMYAMPLLHDTPVAAHTAAEGGCTKGANRLGHHAGACCTGMQKNCTAPGGANLRPRFQLGM